MNKTTNFTKTQMRVIDNPKNFSNEEYAHQVNFMFQINNLVQKIIMVYRKDYNELNAVTQEEKNDYTEEELRQLEYMDDIEKISWTEYNNFTREIMLRMYFDTSYCEDLFHGNMTLLKSIIMDIKQRIDYAMDMNFSEDFESRLLKISANINYCILCCIGGFKYLKSNNVYNFLKFYKTRCDDKVYDRIASMYEYFKVAKPSLSIFENYPELASVIESKVPEDVFIDLVNLSNYITEEDIKDIASGKIKIDQIYIDNLQELAENDRGEL